MPTQRRRKLLLADDSPTVQKVVSLTFADEGLEVVSVSTGAEALAEIEREVPDIVLADVHMPAPGGYEVCARVKRTERTRRVPVVLLVGAFEPFDQAEARRCGADEVLTKPFQSIRELVNKVGVLLGAQPEEKPADARADVEDTDATGELRATATGATSARATMHTPHAATDDARALTDESARAGHGEPSPSPAFADSYFDDAGIEAATPEEFAARSREQHEVAEASAEFAESAASFGGAREFGASQESSGASPRHAPQHAPQSFAAAASASASPAPSFDARADADDALLDLGDVDSPRPQADDFVLDLDEDADTYVPQRAAQAAPSYTVETARAVETAYDDKAAYEEKAAYTDAASYSDEPAYLDETPAAVEMQSAGSVSMAEPSVAWVAAEELAASPEAVAEPVAAPAQELTETSAPVVPDETDRAAHVAPEPESQTSPRRQTQTGAVELSSEAIDAIARRVVEQLSERVLREIAWEVVPDLAERLIRQKLEEERARQ